MESRVIVYLFGVLWFWLSPKEISTFYQNDYNIKFEILEITDFNRSFISKAKLGMHWYNRSRRVMNGDIYIIKNLGMHIRLNMQVYKFASNEFRFFPVTMAISACEEIPKNIFGTYDLLKKYTNALGCPFKVGHYYIRNGVFDVSKLPPYLPRGQYKIEVRGYNDKDYVGEVIFVGTVIDA